MKKNIFKALPFIIPTAVVALALIITISINFAWYTNVDQVGKIDANTKNVGISYTINDETLSTDEYDISNLAFFDIDSIYEGKYFKDMFYKVKLTITNITPGEIYYSVAFNSEKMIKTLSGDDKSISYVGCYLSPVELGYYLTVDTVLDDEKTYYLMDETHNLTEIDFSNPPDGIEAGVALDSTVLASIYEYNEDYMIKRYQLTEDANVKAGRIYYVYDTTGTKYLPCATRGVNVSKFSNITGYKVYEASYTSAAESSFSQGTNYYSKYIGTNGDVAYVLENIDSEAKFNSNKSKLYTRNAINSQNLNETNDILLQNESYYILVGENYVELNKLVPTASLAQNTYFEMGYRIADLTSLETITSNTADAFNVRYDGGVLNNKDDYQVMYLYLYGVQEIDEAINSDFIFNSHHFTITIETTSETNYYVNDGIEEEN